jgi:uncharacterized membrane protein
MRAETEMAPRSWNWVAHGSLARPVAEGATGRIAAIDIVRGLAIVAMACANAAGMLLELPHPLWLRLFGGVAAPIFVTLAGMMVAMSAASGRRRAWSFVRRGAFLIMVAALLDACLTGWLPFAGFDVLYVVGLSLPLAFVLARAPVWLRWVVPLGVLALTPLVQWRLGYRLAMPMVPLETPPGEWPGLVSDAGLRFVVDGWFPLFPWLGFALLGVALESWRRHPEPVLRFDARPGLIVLPLGILAWLLAPGEMATRNGYSEPFYPATIGYMITSVGLLLLLLPTASLWAPGLAGRMLQRLGGCSLFLYVAHLVLLERIWHPLVGSDMELVPFLNVCVALLLTLWGLAAWYQEIRQWHRDRGLRGRELVAFAASQWNQSTLGGRLRLPNLGKAVPENRSAPAGPGVELVATQAERPATIELP